MPRPKAPGRPVSPSQIIKATRDVRRAEREARRATQMEIACMGVTAASDAAHAALEFGQWRENQADKREYLAERKRLREEEPTALLAQELELKKTAKERARYMATFAEQERNMADLTDPAEREAVQTAQTRAEEAAREYKSLCTIVSRRQKQVTLWLVKVEDARRSARLEVNNAIV